MLGKRKRGRQPSEEQIQSPHTPSLTHGNLKTLDAELAADVASITKNYPSPFDVMPYQTASTQKKTGTTGTNLTKAEHILELLHFHVNRNKPLPKTLQDLVQKMKTPRQGDVTPKSKKISIFEELHQLSEDMELHALADKMVYRAGWYGDTEIRGEALVWKGCNDQWSDRIPRPPKALEPASALAEAMDELNLPKKPRPDFSYGYRDEAFSADQRARIKLLPADLLVYPKAPWFPYQVTQWKGNSGTVREAEQQIRLDAACAIDTIYRFFKLAHPYQEPSPENTCMFSLVIFAPYCQYRIHWRRVDDNKTVSYEGDVISQAFFNDVDAVFKTRGVIFKTLDWARGSRLAAIKGALEALGSKTAVQQARYAKLSTMT
ncbi:MAG: hypothetical protein Q9193_003182 [Seirophora villosa]